MSGFCCQESRASHWQRSPLSWPSLKSTPITSSSTQTVKAVPLGKRKLPSLSWVLFLLAMAGIWSLKTKCYSLRLRLPAPLSLLLLPPPYPKKRKKDECNCLAAAASSWWIVLRICKGKEEGKTPLKIHWKVGLVFFLNLELKFWFPPPSVHQRRNWMPSPAAQNQVPAQFIQTFCCSFVWLWAPSGMKKGGFLASVDKRLLATCFASTFLWGHLPYCVGSSFSLLQPLWFC